MDEEKIEGLINNAVEELMERLDTLENTLTDKINESEWDLERKIEKSKHNK